MTARILRARLRSALDSRAEKLAQLGRRVYLRAQETRKTDPWSAHADELLANILWAGAVRMSAEADRLNLRRKMPRTPPP